MTDSLFQIVYTGGAEHDLASKYRELHHFLVGHVCEVTFTTVAGGERVMLCTLRADKLPLRDAEKTAKTKALNYDAMIVWCLDKSNWRCFRTESVKLIKVLKD